MDGVCHNSCHHRSCNGLRIADVKGKEMVCLDIDMPFLFSSFIIPSFVVLFWIPSQNNRFRPKRVTNLTTLLYISLKKSRCISTVHHNKTNGGMDDEKEHRAEKTNGGKGLYGMWKPVQGKARVCNVRMRALCRTT